MSTSPGFGCQRAVYGASSAGQLTG